MRRLYYLTSNVGTCFGVSGLLKITNCKPLFSERNGYDQWRSFNIVFGWRLRWYMGNKNG